MQKLDYFDHQILRLLVRENRRMNANEVSECLNIAWLTAKKHLKNLANIGYVSVSQRQGIKYYRANY